MKCPNCNKEDSLYVKLDELNDIEDINQIRITLVYNCINCNKNFYSDSFIKSNKRLRVLKD